MNDQTEELTKLTTNSSRKSWKSTKDLPKPSNSRSKTLISIWVNQEVKVTWTGQTNKKLLTTGKPQLKLTKEPQNNGLKPLKEHGRKEKDPRNGQS